MPLSRSLVRDSGYLEKERKRQKKAFDAMVAETLEEVAEQGARTVDDVLTQMDTVIEAADLSYVTRQPSYSIATELTSSAPAR